MKSTRNHRMKVVWLTVLVGMLLGRNANGDFLVGTPVNLGPSVNSISSDGSQCISADGLELIFSSDVSGNYDLYAATRPTVEDGWEPAANLGTQVNTAGDEICPTMTSDGLTLFFSSVLRPGGYGQEDIWMVSRTSRSDVWNEPVNLGPPVNTSARENQSSISADGLSLFFESDRSGGYGRFDLWVATRATTEDSWGEPVNLGPAVNTSYHDRTPSISADGRALFFASNRPGGLNENLDLWVTTRTNASSPFETPIHLGPIVNSLEIDAWICVSSDGSSLIFASTRLGGMADSDDMWESPIVPIVDFNGDEGVDAADIEIMIDCWGTDESLCDIGPFPWGDGVVDVEDLIVLVEHIVADRADAEDTDAVE